ncbi:DNA helicase [Tanacetum coccineum]
MPERKMTTLIEWYEYNDTNTDERHLTYLEFPSEFVCQNIQLLKPSLAEEEQRRSQEFADWLLHVGDGELRKPDEEDADDTCWLDILAHFCVTPDKKKAQSLIDFIYDEDTTQKATILIHQEKAICVPKNDTVDVISTQIFSRFEGEIINIPK